MLKLRNLLMPLPTMIIVIMFSGLLILIEALAHDVHSGGKEVASNVPCTFEGFQMRKGSVPDIVMNVACGDRKSYTDDETLRIAYSNGARPPFTCTIYKNSRADCKVR